MEEEQPDAALPKEPLPGVLFIPPPKPEAAKLADSSDSEQSQAEAASEEAVPPELSKRYYFGCGPCRPALLQWLFARKKFFTLLLCCFAFLQGAIVSGKLYLV